MKTLAHCFHHMGQRLKAGLSLSEAMEPAANHPSKTGQLFRRALVDIDRRHGLIHALYRAGPRWPSFVWAHLEAGEASGQLAPMMNRLSEELDQRRQWVLNQVFNLRTLYLLLVMLAASFAFSVLGAVDGLSEATLGTDSGTVLQAIIDSATRRLWGWIAFFALCGWLFVRFQLAWKHRLTDRFAVVESIRLKLPLTSRILRLEELARYLSLLAMCIRGGLPIYQTLRLAQMDIGFPKWRRSFEGVPQRIDAGAELSEAFEGIDGFDHELIQSLKTGEITGGTADLLEKTAEELQQRARRLRSVLQIAFSVVAFILAIGLTVIVLVKGFMAPLALYERAF